MPIRVVKVFVAICPVCKKRISCTGECDWDVWPTREDLHEALEESTDPAKTWDLRIARSCGRKCEDLYLEAHGHRTFKSTPNEGRPSDHAPANP